MNYTKETKKDIINWGKRLYDKGLMPALSGNISIKRKDEILVTASGSCAGDLAYSDIISINSNGIVIKGDKKPTSEKNIHLKIYNGRDDINAVIHSHCPSLTAFAVCNKKINKQILPDFALFYDEIDIIPYFCPSTDELSQAVSEKFQKTDIVLLKNHGLVLGAKNLKAAFYKLETLDNYVKTFIYSKIIGNPKTLNKKSIMEIRNLFLK